MPDIPQEYIDFMKTLKSVMDDTSRSTSDLSDANKDLRKTENEIFKTIKSGLKVSKDLEGSYKKQIKDIKDYKSAIAGLCGEIKKEVSLYTQIRAAKEAVARSHKEDIKSLKANEGALKKLLILQAKANASYKRSQLQASLFASKTALASGALGALGSVTKKTIGAISSFIGVLGLSTISLGSIMKEGIGYERTLFRLSRAQEVAGRGAGDFNQALDSVVQKSTLARDEFAQLAETVMKSFLGVAPSLTDIGDLQLLIAKQVGPELEAQKDAWSDLLSVQGKFPSLYEDIIASAQIMDKIRSGQGTDVDEKRLAIDRERLVVQMANSDMSQKEITTALTMITQLTDAEQKSLAVRTEQQKLNKELRETQLGLYKELKPLMIGAMKVLTKIIKFASDHKTAILAVAGAFVVLKNAMGVALAVGAMFGPLAAVLAGVAAAVAMVATGFKVWKIGSKTSEEIRVSAESTRKIEKDRLSLSKQQVQRYDELWTKQKGSVATEKERLEKHKEIYSQVQSEIDDTSKLVLDYRKIKKDVEARVELANKVLGGLQAEIDLAEKFGAINSKALQDMIEMSQVKVGEQARTLEAILGRISQSYGDGINLDVTADIGDQASQMKDFLLAQSKSAKTTEERVKAENDLTQLYSAQKDYRTSEANQTEAMMTMDAARVRQQEQFSSAYESRLNTQRQLMESAQFGLGASVEMMQKQVDLAYTLMQTYEKTNQQMKDRISSWGKVSESQIASIENSKTQEEAESNIKKIVGLTAVEQSYLNKYAVEYQKNTDKTMQQQQKIYNLTKDIREGYLDAIREMSVGAGEFEKIIGSQEMGVTQLMGAVQDVTGIAKLNTMALGGLQDKALTAQGVGTDITGKYTAGGIQFIGGETQERRNSRIWKYGESKAKTEAVMRGEVGGAPRVGTGVAGGREPQYIRPDQEEEKIVYDGTYKALTAWSRSSGSKDIMGAINIGVKRNSFSRGEVAGITSGGGGAGAAAMGAGYLQGSNAPTPASGGWTTAPGRMAIPKVPKGMFIAKARKASLEEEAIYNRKMQEMEEEFNTLRDKNKILRMDLKTVRKGSSEYKKLVREIKFNQARMRGVDYKAEGATRQFSEIGVTGIDNRNGMDFLGLGGKKGRGGKGATSGQATNLPEFQDVPTKYLADKEKIALLDMSAAEASVKYYESQKKTKFQDVPTKYLADKEKIALLDMSAGEASVKYYESQKKTNSLTKEGRDLIVLKLYHANAIAKTDQEILNTQEELNKYTKIYQHDWRTMDGIFWKQMQFHKKRLDNLKKTREEQGKGKEKATKELDLKKQEVYTEEEKQAFIKANVPAMKATEQAQEAKKQTEAFRKRATEQRKRDQESARYDAAHEQASEGITEKGRGGKGATSGQATNLPEFQDVPTKYLADKEKIALLDMSAAEASVKYYESQKKTNSLTKEGRDLIVLKLYHANAIAKTDQEILNTQEELNKYTKIYQHDWRTMDGIFWKQMQFHKKRLDNLKKTREEQGKGKEKATKELDLKKQEVYTEEEKQAFIKANVPAMKATEQAQEGSAKRAAAKARAEQEYNTKRIMWARKQYTKRIMWARKQYARQGVFKKTSDRAPGEQGPLTQSGGFTEAKIGGSLGPGEQGPLTQAENVAVQRMAFGRGGQGGSSESRTLAERSKKWREEMSTTMKSAQPEGQFTSAAQKYGFKSSEKYQQDYAANAQEREAMYGIEPEGGAGGAGGRVLVTISLAPGLQGQIDDATNAAVELRVASG